MLWAGIKAEPGLHKLQGNIEDQLEKLGFEKEGRPFTPHLTICRVKAYTDGKELGKLTAEARPHISMDFVADSFVLFKSVLSPKGAEYTELKRIGL